MPPQTKQQPSAKAPKGRGKGAEGTQQVSKVEFALPPAMVTSLQAITSRSTQDLWGMPTSVPGDLSVEQQAQRRASAVGKLSKRISGDLKAKEELYNSLQQWVVTLAIHLAGLVQRVRALGDKVDADLMEALGEMRTALEQQPSLTTAEQVATATEAVGKPIWNVIQEQEVLRIAAALRAFSVVEVPARPAETESEISFGGAPTSSQGSLLVPASAPVGSMRGDGPFGAGNRLPSDWCSCGSGHQHGGRCSRATLTLETQPRCGGQSAFQKSSSQRAAGDAMARYSHRYDTGSSTAEDTATPILDGPGPTGGGGPLSWESAWRQLLLFALEQGGSLIGETTRDTPQDAVLPLQDTADHRQRRHGIRRGRMASDAVFPRWGWNGGLCSFVPSAPGASQPASHVPQLSEWGPPRGGLARPGDGRQHLGPFFLCALYGAGVVISSGCRGAWGSLTRPYRCRGFQSARDAGTSITAVPCVLGGRRWHCGALLSWLCRYAEHVCTVGFRCFTVWIAAGIRLFSFGGSSPHHRPISLRPRSGSGRFNGPSRGKVFMLLWLTVWPGQCVQIWQQSIIQGQPVFTTSGVSEVSDIRDVQPVRVPNAPIVEPLLRAGPRALRTVCVFRMQDAQQPTVLVADDRVHGRLLCRMVCSAYGLSDSDWQLHRLVESLPSLPTEQYVLSPTSLAWNLVQVPVDLRPLGGRIMLLTSGRCATCGDIAAVAIHDQALGPCPVVLCRTSQGWFHPSARLLLLPHGDAFQVWPMNQAAVSPVAVENSDGRTPTLEDRFSTSLSLAGSWRACLPRFKWCKRCGLAFEWTHIHLLAFVRGPSQPAFCSLTCCCCRPAGPCTGTTLLCQVASAA